MIFAYDYNSPPVPTSITGVLVLGMTVVGFLYLISISIYNIYFHPLASYPGPKHVTVSRLWWLIHAFRGDLSHRTRDLHATYGEVVRIAPNELSFTNPRCWKDIYGHSRHNQPENYKDPAEKPRGESQPQSILFANRAKHAQLRRLLSHGFSERGLRDQEPVLQFYTELLIKSLFESCGNKHEPGLVDLVKWYNYTTFDMIGHLAFNESFNCLGSSSYHPWVELIFESVKHITLTRAMNRIPILWRLSNYIIPTHLRQTAVTNKRLTREKVLRRLTQPPAYIDLMTTLIQGYQKQIITEADLTVNGEVLVVAGSETTATLLSGATYYLLKNPRVMIKLVHSIRSSFGGSDEISLARVSENPYIMAVLHEAFRLYPPAATAHPRISPPKGTIINGSFVPGHTRMGMNQFAVFRSPLNFSNPNSFIPERWLSNHPGFESDQKEALQPFSFGPRNCLGRNLAYAELRLILTKILYSFDMELMEHHDDWLQQKIYIMWEKKPLMVRLTPAQAPEHAC